MIVILASRRDDTARALAERWRGSAVMTCADLARPGWRLTPGGSAGDTAVVDGASVRMRDVDGVLVRLAGPDAWELPHVLAADRDYVAAELRAFLYAWLGVLRCPVVDRSSEVVVGRDVWLGRAARLDIPVVPRVRRTDGDPDCEPAPALTVAVVGGRVVGGDDRAEARHARRLAAATGVQALSARFDAQGRLAGADMWPDVGDGAVADALLEVLEGA